MSNNISNQQAPISKTEISLKKEIKKQSFKKQLAEMDCSMMLTFLIEMIYKHKDTEKLTEIVEQYHFMIKEDSKQFGIKTVIKDYIYKQGKNKGKVVQAHYTINNKFLEIVKEKNTEPKYYVGNFSYWRVKDYYEIYFPEACPQTLCGFFKLKNKVD